MTDINLTQNVNNTFKPFIDNDNKGNQRFFLYQDIPNDSYDPYHNEHSKKTRKNKGLFALGTGALVTGAGFFIIATLGKTKAIPKGLKKLVKKIDEKANNNSSHKFFKKLNKGIDQGAKILTNITPIKDYTFYKIMNKTKFTKNLWQSVTNTYTRINKGVVVKHQKKALGSYDNFINEVEKQVKYTHEYNPEKTKTKDFKDLEKLIKVAKKQDKSFFNEFDIRYKNMMEDDMKYLQDIMEKESMITKDFTKKIFKGTISENILMDKKTKYTQRIYAGKNNLSYSFKDISRHAKDDIQNFYDIIYSLKNTEVEQALKTDTKNLEKAFKKLGKEGKGKKVNGIPGNENIQNIRKCINKCENKINELKESGKIDANNASYEKLTTKLENLSDLFGEKKEMTIQGTYSTSNKSGLLQDIRQQVGRIWNSEVGTEAEKKLNKKVDGHIKKMGDKAEKDIKEALSSEIKMYDKQRDLTLGAGPTDILGLVGPAALFGVALKKDRNSDERVETTLKTGVPVLGGTCAYLWSIARQYNGGPALLFSLGTAAVLNFVGDNILNKYKHRKEEKHKQMHELGIPHTHNN